MSYQYQGQPGYPPSYPPPVPPRKSNTALIVVLIFVIVAAVVALVLVLLLRDGKGTSTGAGSSPVGDSTASAQALGQKVAEVIQNHLMADAERLVCKPESKFLRSMRGIEGVDLTVTLHGVTESGDTADAAITMVRQEDKKSSEQKIHLKKVDGKWCIN